MDQYNIQHFSTKDCNLPWCRLISSCFLGHESEAKFKKIGPGRLDVCKLREEEVKALSETELNWALQEIAAFTRKLTLMKTWQESVAVGELGSENEKEQEKMDDLRNF